jgi:hypothetical protein
MIHRMLHHVTKDCMETSVFATQTVRVLQQPDIITGTCSRALKGRRHRRETACRPWHKSMRDPQEYPKPPQRPPQNSRNPKGLTVLLNASYHGKVL